VPLWLNEGFFSLKEIVCVSADGAGPSEGERLFHLRRFPLSKFKKLSASIQKKEGVSKESADKITAAIGRKSIGQAEMTKRSVTAKKK
jgi:hypothetical protein